MDIQAINWISQIGINVFGIVAIVLVARKNKWGFVSGLISQPFWFVMVYTSKQWGLLPICIIYLVSWIYGTYNWFKHDPVGPTS